MAISSPSCICGASYEAFRCGETFATMRAAMYVGCDDPLLWRNRSTPAVLREMAWLKRAMWQEIHGHCVAEPAPAVVDSWTEDLPAWVTER